MAKSIATITGTALRPGVSRNKRWYKPEHVAGAVAAAQKRLGEGAQPMVMLTFHGAEDNSREIAASLTGMALEADGSATFTADLTDTAAGRDIAALVDSSDGKPAHLRNVSIRGAWTGKVRKERHPDGGLVETADGLELDGVDFTRSPGVDGAEIRTFAWAAEGQTETQERVLITESVQEPHVTVSEGVTYQGLSGGPESAREALRLVFGDPAAVHVTEADNATPAISKRGSGMSGGGRQWADPGYQSDHKQRYDITTKQKALTAWRYIHQKAKSGKYSSEQLSNIKKRIRAALKRFGVKAASGSDETTAFWGFTESAVPGWSLTAFQVTEELAEYFGDPSRSGSWCISASNGDVSMTMSSYCMNPADLDAVLRKAVDGCCSALKTLDPDMDGDVDVPGTSGDTDGDAGPESAPADEDVTEDDPATEDPAAEAADTGPAPAGTNDKEDSGMTETSTNDSGAGAQSGLTLETITQAFVTALQARDDAREQAKAAKKAAEAREAAEVKARKDALTEALAELGIKIPATEATGNATAETASDGGITEADVEKRIAEAVDGALTEFKQGLVVGGIINPQRAGMVVREHNLDPDTAPSAEDLAKEGDDDFMAGLGAALNQGVTTSVPQVPSS